MVYFSENIAARYGVNAAVVAEHLVREFLYSEESNNSIRKVRHREYCRCGARALAGELACLSQNQVSYAFNKLVKNGVIVKKQLSKPEFDSTNWYAFTDYGINLVLSRDSERFELLS